MVSKMYKNSTEYLRATQWLEVSQWYLEKVLITPYILNNNSIVKSFSTNSSYLRTSAPQIDLW